MPRSMWTGSISFGLVNIPVKLFTATKSNDIGFHQLDGKTKCRARQKLYCPETNSEINRAELVKGYELNPDEYVVVSREELDALAPEASKTIDITDFVDLSAIDPIYYDKPYYLVPEKAAQKAYRLLVKAMQQSRKVAIAKFVMRNKEYLVALRPLNNVICLEIMRFHDEVVKAEEIDGIPEVSDLSEKELKMAQQLIDALSEDFEPEKYHDEYKEKLRDLIERKAQGETITPVGAERESKGRVINLLAALEQSLAKTKKSKESKSEPKPKKKSA